MKKNLVICPACELEAKNSVHKWKGSGFNLEVRRPKPLVIGAIDEEGNFKIKRGGENYTVIRGDNFVVHCGNCGEPVYRKEVNNENTNNWSFGVHRFSFATQTFGTLGSN